MFAEKEPVYIGSASDWEFIEELKSEYIRKPHWTVFDASFSDADFQKGVVLRKDFPDPENVLDTAWEDMERFLKTAGIPLCDYASDNTKVLIRAVLEDLGCYESYHIDIDENRILIRSGDTEGVRRGIFHLQDLLLRSKGSFLPKEVIKRTPWIKNRISRCFFGPIKRPPFYRDELTDDIDYYPEEYLNRLSHEGINVLWITAEFRDIVKTDLVPEYGKDRMRRLKKLEKTVEKCQRYGIKIFLFCIEPKIWGPDDPLVVRNPKVAGARAGSDICFCPFSSVAQQYLYEAVKSIFTEVPKLGGMISITHGERTTSCLSSVPAVSDAQVSCPVCSQKEKGEILRATHEPILKAMHEVNHDAQFVSWMYMPQVQKIADWKDTIPSWLPKETVPVFNFESGATKEQLGKIRTAGDYWQYYLGPSDRFIQIAKAARKAGIKMGAKIQVGCSHEVATIPFVPVPSILWQKYKAMFELNVGSVIQSWYFGNYPGIMNKAAGELAFEDFKLSKDEFLLRLAETDWGVHAIKVQEAWKLFHEAYSRYPMDTVFQYYGPMHDGVVWPLHLFPVHKPLCPTWKPDFPPSGDSIGECLISFTLKEAVTLCGQMAEGWRQGVECLKGIEPFFLSDPKRLKDLYVAYALGIQFESGYQILRFYDLRDEILWNQIPVPEQLQHLSIMKDIVKEEIERSLKMVELCRKDSRLGFHSECEGYKYFKEKLLWRVRQLEYLLEYDFPKMKSILEQGEEKRKLLIKLTTPSCAPVARCDENSSSKGETFRWNAHMDSDRLTVTVTCKSFKDSEASENSLYSDILCFHIKAGDLGYPYHFRVDLTKEISNKPYSDTYIGYDTDSFCEVKHQNGQIVAVFSVNLNRLPGYCGQSALAIYLVRKTRTDQGETLDTWCKDEMPYIRPRLCLSDYNPEAMGKLELH